MKEFYLSTVPNPPVYFNISIKNGKTLLTWQTQEKEDCSTFILYKGKKPIETNLTQFEFEEELYCTYFKLQTKSNDDFTKSKELIRLIPGKIRNLLADPNMTTTTKIGVKWDPPLNSSCVVNYLVKIDDTENLEELRGETNISFVVDVCSQHKIEVFAKSSDGISAPEILTNLTPTFPEGKKFIMVLE